MKRTYYVNVGQVMAVVFGAVVFGYLVYQSAEAEGKPHIHERIKWALGLEEE